LTNTNPDFQNNGPSKLQQRAGTDEIECRTARHYN